MTAQLNGAGASVVSVGVGVSTPPMLHAHLSPTYHQGLALYETSRLSTKGLSPNQLTYLLTSWCRIFFEKLIVTQFSNNSLLSLWKPKVSYPEASHWILF
jgi:hypothetical protein